MSKTTTDVDFIEAEGYSLFASLAFSDHMFFYLDISNEEADVYWLITDQGGNYVDDGNGLLTSESLSYGLGMHFPVSAGLDLFGRLGRTSTELIGQLHGYGFDYAETDSTDLRLGMRARLHESFELEFAWDKITSDLIDGTGYNLGARIHLTDVVALSLFSGRLSPDGSDDVDTLALGLEFHF